MKLYVTWWFALIAIVLECLSLSYAASLRGTVPELESAGFLYFYDSQLPNRKIYQLSTFPNNNSALYYYVNNYADLGLEKLIIIQNITCDPRDELRCSPSSLFYYAVDLKTKQNRVLTQPGLTNNAVINGSHLYVTTRSDIRAKYDQVVRIHLNTLVTEYLCSPDPGWDMGPLSVNATGSDVLFVQTWNNNYQLMNCQTAAGGRRRLINTTNILEHVRFHPKNSSVYFYSNRSRSRLATLGIGDIAKRTNASLYSDINLLNAGQNFPHPFFDKDGNFWVDMLLSNGSGSHVFLTRLTLGGEPFGKVKGASFVEISKDNWQQHFNTGRGELEFVGDGRGGDVPTWGQPYIQKIKLSPQLNLVMFEPVASNYGNMQYTDGTRETNAKFIPFGGGLILWSPFRNASHIEEPGPRQVFATAYD